jgi:hypothetical protein
VTASPATATAAVASSRLLPTTSGVGTVTWAARVRVIAASTAASTPGSGDWSTTVPRVSMLGWESQVTGVP